MVTDLHNKIQYVNRAFYTITGVDEKHAIGLYPWQLFQIGDNQRSIIGPKCWGG